MAQDLSIQEMRNRIQELESELKQVRGEKDAIETINRNFNQILHLIADGAPLLTVFQSMMAAMEKYLPQYQACVLVSYEDASWRVESGTGIHEKLAGPSGALQSFPAHFLLPGKPGDGAVKVKDITRLDAWRCWQDVLLDMQLDSCWLQPFSYAEDGVRGLVLLFAPVESIEESYETRLLEGLKELITIAFARQSAQTRLLQSANHDAQTGLSNRYSFDSNFSIMLKDARRHFQRLAMISIEFGQLSQIREEYGAEFADTTLTKLADILQKSVRDNDLMARFSQHEFVVAVRIKKLEDAEIIAKKILKTVEHPISIRERRIPVRLSLGVSFYPEHSSFNELYQAAGRAMREAEKHHGGYRIEYHGRFCETSADLYDF